MTATISGISQNQFSDEELLKTRQQIERALDQRLAEMKIGIMSRLDQSLGERILSGREAILVALEKVQINQIEC